MDRRVKLSLLSLLIGASLAAGLPSDAEAQCSPTQQPTEKAKGSLASGFTFIKSYPLDAGKVNSKGEIEYSFVFSKGTLYMLTIANGDGAAEDIEITLYDPSRKKLASNVMSGKYIPLGYKCEATGVHYMTFKFAGDSKCGVSVLGFKRL